VDAVYKDVRPVVANAFDSITVSIPASGYTVTNVLSGCTTLADVATTPKTITLNQHPALRFQVPDFDAARSDAQFRAMFLDEAIQKMVNYIDSAIGALIVAANFDAYAVITGGNDTITDANAATAFGNLAGNDVPVRDFDNMSLLVHPVVYTNLLQQATWTQNTTLANGAEDVRRTAIIGQQFGGYVDFDRNLPIPAAGTYNAIYMHRNAIGLVVRALPIPQNTAVQATVVYYRGLPLRITVGWDQTCLSEVATVDTLFGVGVLRKEYGSLITSS
jgi:hypothetical protein